MLLYGTYICGVKSEELLSTTKRDRVSSPVMLASRTLQRNTFMPVTINSKKFYSPEATFHSMRLLQGWLGELVRLEKMLLMAS